MKAIGALLLLLCFQCSALSLVFFTPRDDIRYHLLSFIDQEKKSIDAAVYMFTDKLVAQALVDAVGRGVKVRVVLDQISMDQRFGKGQFLQEHGVIVLVHRTPYKPIGMPLMHHKFFVFEKSKQNSSWAWTGSFNCTAMATKQNDENSLVCNDTMVVKEYKDCFALMVQRLAD